LMRIVILMAMPDESRPLVEFMGGWRRVAGERFPMWLRSGSDSELRLVETGIGNEPATQTARRVLSESSVDLLLSAGFAGSLWPGFKLGQVVWSQELATFDRGSSDRVQVQFRCALPRSLTDHFESSQVYPARFLTVDRLVSKAVLAERLAGVASVTDMESVPVAALAHARDVPFLGLRAVSEESTHEIDWQLDSIMDRAGRIRFEKVAFAVIARPGLAVSFRRLRKNFAIAGRELAQELAALLSLPEEDLRSLAGELQLRPLSEAG
jgi:nucleoside phosphorylase